MVLLTLVANWAKITEFMEMIQAFRKKKKKAETVKGKVPRAKYMIRE
jgi:hypothetical protein